MVTIRRLYIFLVCFISLQAVTWAAIALLQDLIASGSNSSIAFTAFQIAVIVIGLPFFLVHWLWAQRLAGKELEERESGLRRLYLYGTLAAFLAPLAATAFSLLATLFGLPFGESQNDFTFYAYSPSESIIRDVISLIVLGLLWFYHWRVTLADAKAAPETGNAATVHRLYTLSFSATGVGMITLGVVEILLWIMKQFGSRAVGETGVYVLTNSVPQLLIGLALWLPFWLYAQGQFTGSNPEERESTLRKFYLYTIVFIASLSVVTQITLILAGLFRSALSLPTLGDIRDPLSAIISLGVLWAYHAYVLRNDGVLASEALRQATVRRLYLYLVAAVGLLAFLIGLGGDVSVLIRALSLNRSFIGADSKEQLAWFTAALIAGVLVWLWPWRQVQVGATNSGDVGANERRSIIRKIYLYFYLLIATLTVLGSTVYILFRLLSLVLGERSSGNLLSDLAQAIAFGLIAIGVWIYHGLSLRGDGQVYKREQAQRLATTHVVVVEDGGSPFGQRVLEGLRRELPSLTLHVVNSKQPEADQLLAEAGIIVAAWNTVQVGDLAASITASAARKLLAPVQMVGWEWAGVDRYSLEALSQQTVRAVKQIVSGEDVKPVRPMGIGAIFGAIVGFFILLIIIVNLGGFLYSFMRF